MTKVVVGLSGGVDSSAAAALLQEQGYAVEGMTLWLMKGKGQCCSEGLVDAASICEHLGIPHHIVDTRDRFQENIIDYLVQGYEAGITPLPCSQCNRAVKFGPMIDYARQELGIETIATGHYARVAHNSETHRWELHRALDRSKDQSYFLYDLSQEILRSVVFPLGEYTKGQTRELATRFGLSTAEKPESQDLCLIEAHGSMAAFLDQYIDQREGEIVDQQGRVLGKHQGVHHYTIGQRKGLGIAHSEPLYVVALDAARNRVIVGDRPSAHLPDCTVQRISWVSMAAATTPFRAEVQVRYRTPPTPCTVIPLEADRFKIHFDEPQFSITPGQAAVWYEGDRLLGGGIIERRETAA
jgi:tRNA-uridine 2-sulfurtransferase